MSSSEKSTNGTQEVNFDFRFFKELPTAAFIVNDRGRVIHWNAAAESLTGVAQDEMLDKPPWRGFFDQRKITPVDVVLRTEEPAEDASFTPSKFADDNVSSLLFTARPVFDDEGELIGVVSTVQGATKEPDVTVTGLAEIENVVQRMSVNDYTLLAEESDPGVIGNIAKGLNTVRARLLHITDTAQNIARGDLSDLPKYRSLNNGAGRRSENDAISPSLIAMMESVRNTVERTVAVTEAAQSGRLDFRAELEGLDGEFKKVVEGANSTLEAVSGPLNVVATAVHEISRGTLPTPVKKQYDGEYAHLMEGLNDAIKGLSALGEVNDVLQRMAVNDHTLAVTGNYVGIFGDVSTALNSVRDRLLHITDTAVDVAAGNLSDLEAYKAINNGAGKRSDNDRIAPALTGMMESIKMMVEETVSLAEAAQEGDLSKRANPGQLEGEFRKVVIGFNQTLDAILTPIKEVDSVLEKLAGYDLQARVLGEYRGDHGRIKNSLNSTAESLHSAMNQVSAASLQVRSAGTEIAASSSQLAEGASEQASAIEQVSASLEQMASMTKNTVENTFGAKKLAKSASDAALASSKSMSSMLDSMGRIRDAAEATSGIIKDINDIAFQTNLLALNAAVEAARAGDAGRGFAVVAEEVRTLAMRSKEAAHNTEKLIHQSLKLSQEGQDTSREVDGKLIEIVDAVKKVDEIVIEIASASEQQSQGIDQVNTAVTEMDRVVQRNAANAEESASASQELAGQAEELTALVSRFELGENSAAQELIAQSMPSLSPEKARISMKPALSRTSRPSIGSQSHTRSVIPFDDDEDFENF